MNLSTISANSAGSALEKFNIYQESTQAKLSELTNQFQIFSNNAIESGFIKGIIDAGKYLLMFANTWVGQTMIKVVALTATVSVLGMGFGALKKEIMASSFAPVISAMIQMITSGGKLTGVINALTIAMSKNPIFLPALIIGSILSITSALDKMITPLEKQINYVQELTDGLASLKSEYEGLKSKADLTDLESARLKLLEAEIFAQEQLIKQEAERQYLMSKRAQTPSAPTSSRADFANFNVSNIQQTIDSYSKLTTEITSTREAEYERQKSLASLTTQMTTHAQELVSLKEKGVQLTDEDEKLLAVILELTTAQKENNDSVETALPTYDSVTQRALDYMTALDELTAIEAKNKEGAGLSYEEKEKLIKQYPILANHVIAMADGYHIEAGALTTLKDQLYDTSMAQLQADKEMITSAINRTRQILGLNQATLMSYKALMSAFLGGDVLQGYRGSSQGVHLTEQQQGYLNQLNQLKGIEGAIAEAEKLMNSAKVMGGSGGGSKAKSSGSKSSTDTWKEAFDAQYKLLQHKLEMDLITEAEYLDKLDVLYKKYFANKTKYTDEFMQYEAEVYTKRKKIEEDLLKERLELQKKALEEQKDALNTLVDQTLTLIKYEAELEKEKYNTLIAEEKEKHDTIISNLQDEIKEKKKAIETELEGYRRVIEAQLESLRLREEERDFNKDISEKQKELAKLQAELLEVSFDDTAEGRAKRLQLEEEVAKQTSEIDEMQHDRGVELQEEALNKELEKYEQNAQDKLDKYDEYLDSEEKRYEDSLEKRTKEYEDHVKDIDAYLKKEGLLRQEARKKIEEGDKTLFDKLLEYNLTYGDGTKQSFVDIWETASQALDKYANKQLSVLEILAQLDSDITGIDLTLGGKGSTETQLSAKGKEQLNQQKYLHDMMVKAKSEGNTGLQKWIVAERAKWGMDSNGKITKQFHDGGIVDGKQPLKSTEIVAKLLKGELVTTEYQADNFVKNVLPKIVGVNGFGGENGEINVEIPIQVLGDLDKSVLPDIEGIIKKTLGELNSAMFKRGNTRNARAYSI